MVMQAQSYSPEAYLELELSFEERHEYINGDALADLYDNVQFELQA